MSLLRGKSLLYEFIFPIFVFCKSQYSYKPHYDYKHAECFKKKKETDIPEHSQMNIHVEGYTLKLIILLYWKYFCDIFIVSTAFLKNIF